MALVTAARASHGGDVQGSTCWLARSAALTPAGDDWLSPHELAYTRAQRFTKRRDEFRIARFTAKTAIAHTLGLPTDPATLRRIEVRHEPSGAPFPALDGEPLPWRVSLTDRADWAVCLLSNGPDRIGCDLELVEARTDGFVADYLTAAEQRIVHASTDPDHRALAANLIWSAKESALKVLTTGLRRDTRSVQVDLAPSGTGWQPLRVTAVEGITYPGWWCRFGEFVLTVAGADLIDTPTALDDMLDAAVPSHDWLRRPLHSAH
jgi:4'-phosphopantetheinyl transferase